MDTTSGYDTSILVPFEIKNNLPPKAIAKGDKGIEVHPRNFWALDYVTLYLQFHLELNDPPKNLDGAADPLRRVWLANGPRTVYRGAGLQAVWHEARASETICKPTG